ncbi:MAG: hypothetical protein IH940_09690 [Acidobacteria bacterium]|nr:hypothetical protein [Acidobacteriota bacterium]
MQQLHEVHLISRTIRLWYSNAVALAEMHLSDAVGQRRVEQHRPTFE